ncbi:hypothetical protein J2T12_003012 [Paenibacillus anaericanus]|nr:hypothetical protein [Paenibacillus anaericanus]
MSDISKLAEGTNDFGKAVTVALVSEFHPLLEFNPEIWRPQRLKIRSVHGVYIRTPNLHLKLPYHFLKFTRHIT